MAVGLQEPESGREHKGAEVPIAAGEAWEVEVSPLIDKGVFLNVYLFIFGFIRS